MQTIFFNAIFVSSHMYPENPEGTQVIVIFITLSLQLNI